MLLSSGMRRSRKMTFAWIMDVCALPGAMVWTSSPYELGQGTWGFPRKLRFEKGKMNGIAFLGELDYQMYNGGPGVQTVWNIKAQSLKDHTEKI